MEKLIRAMGGTKCNPLGDDELDLGTFLKNVAYLILALVSISFTAGNYISVAKSLPPKISGLELRMDQSERKMELSSLQISNMAELLKTISADVRDIRQAQMRESRGR